ncbi:MAG: amino acid permease [Planctomycetales bacterium]|nr:amino acid permease [Planctomycetales bacterium]
MTSKHETPSTELPLPPDDEPRLVPALGFFAALAVVIGTVIGSGIFFKPQQVASAVGDSIALMLVLWGGCGLVNLCGALAMAELAAMLPHTGGNYVYLREAYGRLWAFLWVWAEFWVMRSGAIAALAAALALAIKNLLLTSGHASMSPAAERTVIIVAIALLGVVNVAGVHWGGLVQTVTTVIKAGFLALLGMLPFWVVGSDALADAASLAVNDGVSDVVPTPEFWSHSGVIALGTALGAIMWAYDGWGQVTVVAEEVEQPRRQIPWALCVGVLLLTALYMGANWAFYTTLTAEQLANSDIAAVPVLEKLLPGFGERLTLAMLMISVFGALNANVLVGPRVLYAASRDHRLLAPLRRIDPRTGTPAIAIVVLCGWSIVLVLLADLSAAPDERLFDKLTGYVIFGGSIFYLAAVVAVYVLRRKMPDAPRPYRTWGYPWVPGVFVVAYVGLLASMLLAGPIEAFSGLVLILLGAVAYAVIGRRQHEQA